MNVKEMEDMVNNYKPSKETEASADQLDFGLKIVIDQLVYQKVMYWVNKSEYEVSGLGNVVFEPETNTLRVIDAIMLPQKNTGTTTDIEAADVAKAMFKLRNAPGTLRWWWHSHVNMNVFWSDTDISTIKTLGNGGWFCATVFNKRNETKSAFCQKTPVRLLASDIPTMLASANKELITQWDDEYNKNVENVQRSFDNEVEQAVEREWASYLKEKEERSALWEEITDEKGNVIRQWKKKPNLVPVNQLIERANEGTGIDQKTGEIILADLASDSELEKWEKSSSDNLLSLEDEQGVEYELAVDEFIKGKLGD